MPSEYKLFTMNLEIEKALKHLKKGKVILCPTDTIWGLSCDATNPKAVEKIYTIKAREKSKSLIVLVSSFEMLYKYIENIPNVEAINFEAHQKPVTVIYSGAKNLASNVYAQDQSVAIRVVKAGFVKELISAFKKPIVSSSANFSNHATALHFDDIKESLKQKVDYTVDQKFGQQKAQSSTILKIESDTIKTIRA